MLGLLSVALVRNGQKLQLSNEPFCPGSGRWQGPGRVCSAGPEPLLGCHPGQNALEMGRVSGQCQGTAAGLVHQGLIAAGGSRQSRTRWGTRGQGTHKPCLSRAARGVSPGQQRHKGFLCLSCRAPGASSLCPPNPNLCLPGGSRQHKPPSSHQEPSLHLKHHHFPPSNPSCLPSLCRRGEGF